MRVPAGVLRPAVSALIAFLAAVTLAHAMTLSDPNWGRDPAPAGPAPATPWATWLADRGREWPAWCDNELLGGRWLRHECVVTLAHKLTGAPYLCVGRETPPHDFWPTDMPAGYLPVCAQAGINIAWPRPWSPPAPPNVGSPGAPTPTPDEEPQDPEPTETPEPEPPEPEGE
jgi:hypothetical protein